MKLKIIVVQFKATAKATDREDGGVEVVLGEKDHEIVDRVERLGEVSDVTKMSKLSEIASWNRMTVRMKELNKKPGDEFFINKKILTEDND